MANQKQIDELIGALEAWKDAGYGLAHNTSWGVVIHHAIQDFLQDRSENSAVLTYRTYQFVLRDEKRELLLMGTAEVVAKALLSKGGD